MASEIAAKFQKRLGDLTTGFRSDLHAPAFREDLLARTNSLDPTQRVFVDVVTEWAEERLTWREAGLGHAPTKPPKLLLLLLGTAGAGKTRSAKTGATQVRWVHTIACLLWLSLEWRRRT